MQKIVDLIAPRTRVQAIVYFFVWLGVINVYSLGVELFVGGGEMRGSVVHQLVALNLAAIPFLVLAVALISHQYALQQRLTALATTDALTGLQNRRGFLETVAPEGIFKTDGILFLLDIDRFKSINDRFGHEIGDLALKCVARNLMASMRETDTACRHGGEEFAIFLADARSDEIRAIAGSLIGPFGMTREYDAPLEVTLSGGAVSVTQETLVESAFRSADVALYRAKEEGRARIISQSGETMTALERPSRRALAS